MKLYLSQHGESAPESIDLARPLTQRGREETQRMAAYAARLNLGVHQIRHSGKTRAEQTASIFGEALSPRGGVVAVTGLAPNDDVRPVAEALTRESSPLMLVGHLPFLARLAGLMLTGDPDRPVVQFRFSGIVALAREPDGWRVAWVVTPELV